MVSFPTTVLVADDGSPESDKALNSAMELARTTGSTLALVHVRSLSPSVAGIPVSPAHAQRLREEGQALVERRTEQVAAQGLTLEHAEVRLGHRLETTVIRTADELGAGLLIVGARGATAGQRYILGDLSLRIVRNARCSILVVHAPRNQAVSPPDPDRQAESHS